MNIIALFTELIPCLFIGYLLGRFNEGLSIIISRPLIRFGMPISIMGLLLRAGIEFRLIQAGFIALIVIILSVIIYTRITKFSEHLESNSLLLGSIFGNTGYIGIPISIALLPSECIKYSVGFDIGATLIIWSLGPSILSQNNYQFKYLKDSIKQLTKSPAFCGLLGAIFIQLTPFSNQISLILWIPSRIIISLAIVVAGIRIGSTNTRGSKSIKTRFINIKNSFFSKLIYFPIITILISSIIKIPNLMTKALVLQSATPTAISILLLSEANSRKDHEKVSDLFIFTTTASILTIPMWSLILNHKI